MPENLTSGTFKIVSFLEGNPPTGVGHILPDFQYVYLNGGITTWEVKQYGENSYRFSLPGYPFTGVVDDKVAASHGPDINVEWIATYRGYQDAYTIEPINSAGRGWTVPLDSEPGSNVPIKIELIIIRPVEPVQFPHHQLFRFVPVRE